MELSSIKLENSCCQHAALSAVIRMTGSIEIRGKDKLNLKIVSENADVIRYAFKIIKRLFNITPLLMMKKKRRLKKNNVYALVIESSDDSIKVLKDLKILHYTSDKGFTSIME